MVFGSTNKMCVTVACTSLQGYHFKKKSMHICELCYCEKKITKAANHWRNWALIHGQDIMHKVWGKKGNENE